MCCLDDREADPSFLIGVDGECACSSVGIERQIPDAVGQRVREPSQAYHLFVLFKTVFIWFSLLMKRVISSVGRAADS